MWGKKKQKDNHEYLTPMELPYMIRLSKSLERMGGWPYKTMGHKPQIYAINNKFYFSLWSTVILGGLMYIRKHQSEFGFIKLGHTYITTLMNGVTVHRIYMTWTKLYKECVSDFIKKYHLMHHKKASDYSLMMFDKVTKMSQLLVSVMFTQGWSAMSAFVLMPAYFNFRNGLYKADRPLDVPLESAVYYDIPIDFEYDMRYHILTSIVNVVLTFDCAFCFVSFDVIVILIVFDLWGHIKILKNMMESFPRPANENVSVEIPAWYTEEELVNVSKLLKNIVNYHRMISKYMAQVSQGFGGMMCIYCAFNQICLCILLFKCTQNDMVETVRYGLIAFYMIELLIVESVCFEMLDSASITIKDYIYGLPWECMDTKNRKIVYFFLANAQEPLSFKALGVLPIGVQTMAGILKRTLSYFIFLRTVGV